MPTPVTLLRICTLAVWTGGVPMQGQAGQDDLAAHFGIAAEPVAFASLPGWAADDHEAAFKVFLRSCARDDRREMSGFRKRLRDELRKHCRAARSRKGPARRFFEDNFRPVRLAGGFFTGYFEPELAASRSRKPPFVHPLYRRPGDLVEVMDFGAPEGWDETLTFGRIEDGKLVPYHDRAEIDAGALSGRGLEIAWLDSPVDLLFTHVQGSARLKLADGSVLRVAYDGKSGHPYTPVGRVLVENGEMTAEELDADSLRRWLETHPKLAPSIIRRNRSYIFFREVVGLPADAGPIGAADVPLTAGRSLAVDKTLHVYGSPVWLDGRFPGETAGDEAPFRRLMVAQDTGSAIVGAARGDIFFGSGPQAGRRAGRMKHAGHFYLLVPRDLLGQDTETDSRKPETGAER